ncbi:Hpt domain-containing protein [Pseudozobellia thermophila]|uniref:Hpt domain-containing protein n=1 Tax=Pseudozobellia thermophila TaxID=192903 RepID=A0A1M6ESP1_9FLAO|nr:Hpt domain-containing protein [Pseudozobellia thermophila]SHI88425.1 Hpt domain-containing protein [Pseudozobellia thermophila]
MKADDLLKRVSDLEVLLNDFSQGQLRIDQAENLKQVFLFFKKTLVHSISSTGMYHSGPTGAKEKTSFDPLRSPCAENKTEDHIDIRTYDAIVNHFKTYDTVLKSLNIEPPMKTEIYSSFIYNNNGKSVLEKRESVDLMPLLDDCMGEMELLEELLKLYEKNAMEFIGLAKIHLQNADYQNLKMAAHKIKAGLAMLKTNDLYLIVSQMEHVCETNKDDKYLHFLYNCFVEELPLVIESLQEALSDLRKNNKH